MSRVPRGLFTPECQMTRRTRGRRNERNCWPVGPVHLVVDLSRPDGPGWGNGWPFGPVRPSTRFASEVAFRPRDRRYRLPRVRHKPLGRVGIKLGPDRRGLAWSLFSRPERAVVRPKGPAILQARVTGPGSSRQHTVRPNGPTVPPTARAMRGIVGPLGRHMSLGPFPARWAGLGERLALWAGHRRTVRGDIPALGPRASFARGLLPTVGPHGSWGRTAGVWRGPCFPGPNGPSYGPKGQPFPQPGSQALVAPANTPSGPTGQPFLQPHGP